MSEPVAARRARSLLSVLWLAAAPWMLFPDLAPGLTVASLTLLLAGRLAARRRLGYLLCSTPLNVPILLYLSLAGAATALSPAPATSLPKLLVLLLGVLGFTLVQDWRHHPSLADRLALGLAGAGGLAAVGGLFSVAWPARQILELRGLTDRLPHLTGGFAIHHNEMAGLMVATLPLAWLAARRSGRGRPVWLLNLFLIAGMLLLTQSRGALLAAIVAGLAAWSWGRWPLRRVLAGLAAVALLGAALLWLSGDARSWLARLDAASKPGTVAATSWLIRLEVWGNAWRLLRDYPAIGVGLYAFAPVGRANEAFLLIGPAYPLAHAHNIWLQAGTTLGWAGLVAEMGLWLLPWAGLWRRGAPALDRALGASLTAYLAFSSADVVSLGQKPGVWLWLLLALAATRLGRPTVAVRRLLWAPLALFLLLTPWLPRNLDYLALDRARLAGLAPPAGLDAAAFAGDPWRLGLLAAMRGDEAAALAHWRSTPGLADVLLTQGRQTALAGQDAEAVAWYDRSLSLAPDAALAYFWRGVSLERLGYPALAGSDFVDAARLLPGSGVLPLWAGQIEFKAAQALWREGALAGAAAAVDRAIAIHPDSPSYHELRGDIRTDLGDERGAQAAYAHARALREATAGSP